MYLLRKITQSYCEGLQGLGQELVLSQHSILRSELKKAFLCRHVGSITENGMITGCHILYQLHGFFKSLQLDLPIG